MEELIPLAGIAMIIAVVATPFYFRNKERARLHETLRLAYDKGQPVPPELIEAIQRGEKSRPAPERDLRTGIVLISVALAMLTMGWTIGSIEDEDAFYIFTGI